MYSSRAIPRKSCTGSRGDPSQARTTPEPDPCMWGSTDGSLASRRERRAPNPKSDPDRDSDPDPDWALGQPCSGLEPAQREFSVGFGIQDSSRGGLAPRTTAPLARSLSPPSPMGLTLARRLRLRLSLTKILHRPHSPLWGAVGAAHQRRRTGLLLALAQRNTPAPSPVPLKPCLPGAATYGEILPEGVVLMAQALP